MVKETKKRRNNMWLVPDEDKKAFLEFFGKSSMPWTQSNPFVMRIAGWKKAPESKNSKEKKEDKETKPN